MIQAVNELTGDIEIIDELTGTLEEPVVITASFSNPTYKGEPGKTPVKGVDYYTSADKQALVSEIKADLPTGTYESLTNSDILAIWQSV